MTRLTRSMLFVPAGRWPMIEKAAASAADAVCIDLEDSVPFDEKVAARANGIRTTRRRTCATTRATGAMRSESSTVTAPSS